MHDWNNSIPLLFDATAVFTFLAINSMQLEDWYNGIFVYANKNIGL